MTDSFDTPVIGGGPTESCVSVDDTAALSEALSALRAGRPVLLCDDVNGEGEGDLVCAAAAATPEMINLMVKKARGLVCLVLTPERCEAIGLEQMPARGAPSSLGDAAMISIEARTGVDTGISAADRARTIAVAADPASTPEDLVQPGHVLPLRAHAGGVGEHPGRIEAAVDLVAASGFEPAAVVCQVLGEDGSTASRTQLEEFSGEHGVPLLRVSDVLRSRRAAEAAETAKLVDLARLMRHVMGHFATGVSVITSVDPEGRPIGTTANAISSVSLDPPLLLACLSRKSETLAAVHAGGLFAVNILSADQQHHSDRFALQGDAARPHEVEFADHDLGIPVLPRALATIACSVEAIHPAGDHEIVVGEVQDLALAGEPVEPLIFYRGGYSRLTIERDDLVA